MSRTRTTLRRRSRRVKVALLLTQPLKPLPEPEAVTEPESRNYDQEFQVAEELHLGQYGY